MRSKLLLLLMGLPALAAADSLFNTGSWAGDSICCFGNGNAGTPSFGQVFTAAPGTDVMTSMAFEMQPDDQDVPFQAYVFQWDGTEIAEAALFTSSVGSIPFTGGFTLATVNTGAVSLTDGDMYMAMFSVIGDGLANNTNWATIDNGSTSADGSFFNNSSVFSDLSTDTWENNGSMFSQAWVYDLEFQNVTPEPGTYGMAALGIALVALARGARSASKARTVGLKSAAAR